MKDQYDNYLCRSYPKLYKERRMNMQQTCMCWGFETGDGWFTLLNGLSLAIQNHIDGRTHERWRIRKGKRKYAKMTAAEQIKNNYLNDDLPPRIQQVVVGQVKEKFGTLRFYYSGGDEAIHNYVSMAEALSYVTCDECGAPGKIGGSGWISVKCQEHGGDDFFAADPITEADIKGN
jgi:hypothetical protein